MIDKSARQYYANGQLVKPTRHGLRPGYRGDDAYGGGRSSGPAGGASSGGNYGGNTGGNQGGGGGDGGAAARQAAAQRAMQATIAAAEREQAARNREQAAQRSREEAAQKVAEQKAAEQEAKSKELGAALHGPISSTKSPVTTDTSMVENMIAGPIQGIINQPPKDERVPDFVKEIITPTTKDERVPDFVKETITPTTPLRTRIQDDRAEDIRRKALGDIALQTDKSLMDVSDPSKQGIMSGFADTGKSMVGNQLKKAATSFALNKLGLGFLNPVLGIASLFGKDPIGALMAKMPKGTGTKTAWAGPNEEDLRGGDQNIVQASIEKFQPTDQQTAQMNEIMRKRKILQGKADQGELNEKGMNTLAQMNQLIKQYQVDPRSIYG